MTKIHSDVLLIKKDVKSIIKTLEGNGKKGLVDVVYENRDFRIESQTKSKMLKMAVGSGWAVTILVLVFGILSG